MIGRTGRSVGPRACKLHRCELDGASQQQVGNSKQLAPACGNTTHGYRKTRGVSKTGSMGTGMVLEFGTPWHKVQISTGGNEQHASQHEWWQA
jgi:hypothetical protein